MTAIVIKKPSPALQYPRGIPFPQGQLIRSSTPDNEPLLLENIEGWIREYSTVSYNHKSLIHHSTLDLVTFGHHRSAVPGPVCVALVAKIIYIAPSHVRTWCSWSFVGNRPTYKRVCVWRVPWTRYQLNEITRSSWRTLLPLQRLSVCYEFQVCYARSISC